AVTILRRVAEDAPALVDRHLREALETRARLLDGPHRRSTGYGLRAEGETTVHQVRLRTIAREWGRIGCLGFGGPPAHILLLRRLCVEQRGWLRPEEFEDGIAACNLLPGPASTQLAILTA